MTMATLTQKERVAAIEARLAGHAHEHELGDRVWAAKLDAIDQRLRGIERVLLEVRINPADAPQGSGWRRLTRRDVSVMSSTAAATTALWWLTELARTAVGA